MIKGVGPVMATRIVNKFGMDTMDVIEQAPEKTAGGFWTRQKACRYD